MSINFYGLFISFGILAAFFVVEKHKDFEYSALDIFPWLLIPGLIGARIYHVLDFIEYYTQDWLRVFAFWEGGLGIFGALLGGILGLWAFKLKNKLSKKAFLKLLDLVALSLPLAQAIGRWGNFFNQELYGWPTNLPWGIYIKPENRLPGLERFSRFHPLFLYESLGCFLIFIVLLKVFKNKFIFFKKEKSRKNGTIFLLYLLLYSILRFFLEFLRPQVWYINGIRVTHLITGFLILFSGFAIYKKSATILGRTKP